VKFTATEQQIQQMMANAVNASSPMGLGFLQHDSSKSFVAEDFDTQYTSLDYVQGRMVKLWINKLGVNHYQIDDEAPRKDYQSWVSTYPTYEALLASAGIEVTA
jgi:hypothetical protein